MTGRPLAGLGEFSDKELELARHFLGYSDSDPRGYALFELIIGALWVLDGDRPEDARRHLRSGLAMAVVAVADNPHATRTTRRRMLRWLHGMAEYLGEQYGGSWVQRTAALAAEMEALEGDRKRQGNGSAAPARRGQSRADRVDLDAFTAGAAR